MPHFSIKKEVIIMKKTLITLLVFSLLAVVLCGCGGAPTLTEAQKAVCEDCDAEMQNIAEIASLDFSSKTCTIDGNLVYLVDFSNTKNAANNENAKLILNAAQTYCASKLEEENMKLVVYYHNADSSKEYQLFDEDELDSQAVCDAIEE
jgi:hypothetical protein